MAVPLLRPTANSVYYTWIGEDGDWFLWEWIMERVLAPAPLVFGVHDVVTMVGTGFGVPVRMSVDLGGI